MEKYVYGTPQAVKDAWWENVRLRLAPGLPPVFSVFESTGIFEARIYRTSRPCHAKEGATVWLYMIDGPPTMPEAPAFISWPYGASDAWAFGLHPGEDRPQWEVAGAWWELIFLNVCFYSTGREVLSFDEGVYKRSVKTQFSYFRESASMFRSIIDFVTKVGANTNQAESVLSEAVRVNSEAEMDYLERRYEEAGERMEKALQLVNQAMDEAKLAKGRALFWIYLSEWMATTAAALVSAVVLWRLMIRRSLYREVTTTQLRQR